MGWWAKMGERGRAEMWAATDQVFVFRPRKGAKIRKKSGIQQITIKNEDQSGGNGKGERGKKKIKRKGGERRKGEKPYGSRTLRVEGQS